MTTKFTSLLIGLLISPFILLSGCKKEIRTSFTASPANDPYPALRAAGFENRIIPFSPIAGSEAGDLAKLIPVLQNKQVVGLGEATHGTAEFQTAKHKVFQLLATTLQFKNLIIEENFSAVVPVNQYLLSGAGEVDLLLKGLRSDMFKTTTFKALVLWMRDFNRGKPETDQLQLFGMDAQNTGFSAKAIQKMISQYEPAYLPVYNTTATSFLADLTDFPTPEAALAALPALHQKIDDVKMHITANSSIYINGAGTMGYQLLQQHMHCIEQALNQYDGFVTGMSTGFAIRDKNMADNVKWVEQYRGTGSKAMVWVHNGHINLQPQDYFGTGGIKVLGTNLKEMYGAAFYAIGFAFNEGAFNAVNAKTGNTTVFTLQPYRKAYLSLAFARFNIPCFFYDIAGNRNDAALHTVFDKPYDTYQLGAGYDNNIKNALWTYNYSKEFDGLIFIAKTNPTEAL
jgi:erythromycin esterase